MTDRDATAELSERVREASGRGTALRIVGGDTKRFLGREAAGDTLDVNPHRGIVTYDPAELVITARAGTPLCEVSAELAAHGQRFAFEPPAFGPGATIGGTVACGLSGPARAFAGPLRDYVLGVRVLTGDGRVLRFGGEVMKNVAGYDVARTMAGAFGTLGVLLDVSFKVLPRPPAMRTLALPIDARQGLVELERLARTALPLSASCWTGGTLYLRFDGSPRTLDDLEARVGGRVVDDGDAWWASIRDQTHGFFAAASTLWRLHVPAESPADLLDGDALIEWNGTQRWYALDSGTVFETARAAGGYATLFRSPGPRGSAFSEPSVPLRRLHAALKRVFDPAGILNPGRMYPDL